MHGFGMAATAIAVVGLAMTAWVQVRPLRRGRVLLDWLAIVPEWRFFATASIAVSTDFARDTHLVIRDRDGHGHAGCWTPLLWTPERRLLHALWNPHARVDDAVLAAAEELAVAYARSGGENVQQSIRYLVCLRRALEAPRAGAIDRQFAVVHTVGRGPRTLSIDFLSGWHRW